MAQLYLIIFLMYLLNRLSKEYCSNLAMVFDCTIINAIDAFWITAPIIVLLSLVGL